MRSDLPEAPTITVKWRSSDDMGLQHAVPFNYHALAICGAELDYTTTSSGSEKPKCSMCTDIIESRGELPRFW